MIIKLFQPPFGNWVIVAELLNDPPTWDRFIPSHTADSERSRFDSAAKLAASCNLKLKPCENLLKRGTSAFEYDWAADESDVLSHALEVADTFGLELCICVPTIPGSGRSAA